MLDGCTASRSGSPSIRRTCESVSNKSKYDQRAGAPLLWRQAERYGFFSLEKKLFKSLFRETLREPSSN